MKARFGKNRKVEDMVNKICVRETNGQLDVARVKREETGKEEGGRKQERAHLKKIFMP